MQTWYCPMARGWWRPVFRPLTGVSDGVCWPSTGLAVGGVSRRGRVSDVPPAWLFSHNLMISRKEIGLA